MPAGRFVIVGNQRSGTSVTHDVVAGHPDVTACPTEVRASPFFTDGASVFTTIEMPWEQRAPCHRRIFDALAGRTGTADHRARGIKVAIPTPEIAADLANCVREHFPGMRILLVRREDLVAQFASLRRAQTTGQWHSWQSTGESPRITLADEELRSYAKDCLRIEAQLRSLQRTHPLLEVVYERDIRTGRWDQLFEFLDLEVRTIDWPVMQKVAPPAEDYVQDYARLSRMLRTLPRPDEASELAFAEARAEQRLRTEPCQTLIERARLQLASDDAAQAERLALIALAQTDVPPSQRGKGFAVLESAWQRCGDPQRALQGVACLAERYHDDPGYALLSGIVLFHAADRAAGLAEIERALQLDPGLDRARNLLQEWGDPD